MYVLCCISLAIIVSYRHLVLYCAVVTKGINSLPLAKKYWEWLYALQKIIVWERTVETSQTCATYTHLALYCAVATKSINSYSWRPCQPLPSTCHSLPSMMMMMTMMMKMMMVTMMMKMMMMMMIMMIMLSTVNPYPPLVTHQNTFPLVFCICQFASSYFMTNIKVINMKNTGKSDMSLRTCHSPDHLSFENNLCLCLCVSLSLSTPTPTQTHQSFPSKIILILRFVGICSLA